MAARQRLNAGHLAMTLPRRPTSGEVRAGAIERLKQAVDDRRRAREQRDATLGGPTERTAVAALAAATERVAAREAWVKYLEHGY
jgi:hypothetical protein